jgi:hypothetical protein
MMEIADQRDTDLKEKNPIHVDRAMSRPGKPDNTQRINLRSSKENASGDPGLTSET